MNLSISSPAQVGTGLSLVHESELLLALYADVGTSHFWKRFAQALAELYPLDASLLAVGNLRSSEIRAAWAWNMDLQTIRDYIIGGYAAGDDLIRFTMTQEPGHFYSANQHLAKVIDYEENSEVYRKWVAPQGIADVAMAVVNQDRDWITMITFYRGVDRPAFSELELDVLDRLLPHIRRALRMHTELIESQGRPEDLEGWLSLVKIPVLLFNETADCCEMNEAARRFFASQSLMRLEDRRLEFEDPVHTREVAYQVIAASKGVGGQGSAELTVLQLATQGVPTCLVFMPLEDRREGTAVTSAGALVFIHQNELAGSLDLGPLGPVFGLTPTELRICTLLASGLRLQDIANREGKSKETVRSQLKQVFSKTGTSDQARLVLSLLTHPSVLAGF